MKCFKIEYIESGMRKEKYILLESEPPKGTLIETPLCVDVSRQDIPYGGIYGGKVCPYGTFIPSDVNIKEISMEDFGEAVIQSLQRNYIRKNSLKSTVETLL